MRFVSALVLIVMVALYSLFNAMSENDRADYRFAEVSNPRRPDPRLWQADTQGWNANTVIASSKMFPEYDKPDPAVANVKSEPGRTTFSSGSAYLVSPGVWLTARHVVDHCKAVTVEGGDPQSGEYKLEAAHVFLSPDADAAVIRTPTNALTAAVLPLAPENEDGREAFHIGFPQGKPGAVYSRFMGHTTLRWIGASPVESDTIAWAEISRVPDFGAEFGGLSGGLVLNPQGVAVGIVSAGSPRRGRILTTQPSDLWEAIRRDGEVVAGTQRAPTLRITDKSYPAVAREMIQQRRVARVVCENARGQGPEGRSVRGH